MSQKGQNRKLRMPTMSFRLAPLADLSTAGQQGSEFGPKPTIATGEIEWGKILYWAMSLW
jgi:hypothetical protein